MNFIVIIIVSITVLGMGIWLFGKMSEKGMRTVEEMDAEFQNELDNMLCDNLDRVCIPRTEVTVNRGEMAIFPIRVLNNLDGDEDFKARITWSGKVYDGGSLCSQFGGSAVCNLGKYDYKSGTQVDVTGLHTKPYDTQLRPISSIISFENLAPNIDRKHIAAIVIGGGEKGLTYVFDARVCYDDNEAGDDTSGANEWARCEKMEGAFENEKDMYGDPMQLWITVR